MTVWFKKLLQSYVNKLNNSGSQKHQKLRCCNCNTIMMTVLVLLFDKQDYGYPYNSVIDKEISRYKVLNVCSGSPSC